MTLNATQHNLIINLVAPGAAWKGLRHPPDSSHHVWEVLLAQFVHLPLARLTRVHTAGAWPYRLL